MKIRNFNKMNLLLKTKIKNFKENIQNGILSKYLGLTKTKKYVCKNRYNIKYTQLRNIILYFYTYISREDKRSTEEKYKNVQ